VTHLLGDELPEITRRGGQQRHAVRARAVDDPRSREPTLAVADHAHPVHAVVVAQPLDGGNGVVGGYVVDRHLVAAGDVAREGPLVVPQDAYPT
jgi:hypothetical protein